jgi:MFS family permease
MPVPPNTATTVKDGHDAIRPRDRVGWRFIAGFTLAHIGAAFAFVPLLNILAPLKVEAIDPAQKQLLLSAILFWGAVTASVTNIAAGALSDATRSRLGRRRPWIAAGLVGALASYLLVWRAETVAQLLAAILFFQFCFNIMFSALVAIFPDTVPDRQKGMVSGFQSLGYPIGAALGALVIGQALTSPTARYSAIALILAAAIGPFVLLFRERRLDFASPPPEATTGSRTPVRASRDFLFAWSSRLLVQIAFFVSAAYGLYYLEDVVGFEALFPGRRPEQGLALLVVVSTLANVVASVAAGRLSDRTGRRRVFILASGGAIGLAMVIAALFPLWPVVVAAWALLGAGMGAFTAVESALIAQVLPSVRHAGKDLGLMNLGNTLPQCIGPLMAIVLLRGAHPDYRLFFILAGGIAILGALAVQPIRSVR